MDLTAPVADLQLNLTRDTDFVRVLEAAEGESFPPGTQVVLDFGDTQWPATVTTDQASWNVDKAEVNALIAATPTQCHLRYTSGGVDLLWAHTRTVAVDG